MKKRYQAPPTRKEEPAGIVADQTARRRGRVQDKVQLGRTGKLLAAIVALAMIGAAVAGAIIAIAASS